MTTKTLVQELKELVELCKANISDAQWVLDKFPNKSVSYIKALNIKRSYTIVLQDLESILSHAEQKAAEDEKHRLTEEDTRYIDWAFNPRGMRPKLVKKLRYWMKGAGR